MSRHYSQPGTFEAIRKEVIEDPTWTPPEFRLVIWLAAKPPGWVIHPKNAADGTGLTVTAVKTALTGLRRRGLIEDRSIRTTDGRGIDRWEVRFRRHLVVATPTPPESDPQDLTCDEDAEATPLRSDPQDVTSGNTPTPPETASQGMTSGNVKAQVTPCEPLFYPPRESSDIEKTERACREDPLTDTSGVREGRPLNAGTLLAEWLDHCPQRPPARIIGQISKRIKQLLGEGVAYEYVRRGLQLWQEKGDTHPATLDSFVNTAMNGRGNSRRQFGAAQVAAAMLEDGPTPASGWTAGQLLELTDGGDP